MGRKPMLFGALLATLAFQAAAEKIVIAHRGASGYLPEHTLEAKAMAHAMGAHYIEQDVVMTRDDRLIVLHDVTLDRTTDVAEKFPGRARADGRHYAVDFDLEEIRRLGAGEGARMRGARREAVFPERFPLGLSSFRVPTLEEEIELIQGLNRSTGREVGIYPEIKRPRFHRDEGKDISMAVAAALKAYGYADRGDRAFLQTFDHDELKRIREEVFPAVGIEVGLVQLIDDIPARPWMLEEGGMRRLARHADGVGPPHALVVDPSSRPDRIVLTGLAERARAAGLVVHPYTFRLDPGQVPPYAGGFEELLRIHYFEADVDGLFTDFPDRAVRFLQAR